MAPEFRHNLTTPDTVDDSITQHSRSMTTIITRTTVKTNRMIKKLNFFGFIGFQNTATVKEIRVFGKQFNENLSGYKWNFHVYRPVPLNMHPYFFTFMKEISLWIGQWGKNTEFQSMNRCVTGQKLWFAGSMRNIFSFQKVRNWKGEPDENARKLRPEKRYLSE